MSTHDVSPGVLKIFFCGIFLILIYQGLRVARIPAVTPPEAEAACIGEPIVVNFPYLGTVNDPWTCQVQCAEGKEKFILYTNGKATQCEELPGCNDRGEDDGVTCAPPDVST